MGFYRHVHLRKRYYDEAQERGDVEEKRAVGAVWASRSGGRCLFVMPTEGDFSVISMMVNPVA